MWSKVSDDFYDHPKTMCCSLAAVGLWTCCMSYAARHKTNGKIPRAFALSRGTQAEVDELVNAELWDEDDNGWAFHDWSEYQPTPYEQRKYNTNKDEKKVLAGSKGGQQAASKATARTQQIDSPEPEPDSTSKEVRQDVSAVLDFFNSSLEAREVKPKKNPPDSWIRAARLMLDNDGRTIDQIQRCCEWLVTDSFWASNVLSLPKLREKYDQLRLNAQKSTPKQQPVNDDPYFYLNKPRGGSDA